ncbi:unnamed protein product [Adineta steineri]|uniref:Helix-turn-helix domain-containing protein n=1 Tax=Adineta steineri TaxID=433720 RepID=A0A815JS80_9BILA|nr:unnamed protein product [Adineta steineri]CAF3865373.1 unnamed protein product [Adineta steineri]
MDKNNLVWSNHIFDIPDDDYDRLEYTNQILNHFFMYGGLIPIKLNSEEEQEEEPMIDDENINDNDNIELIDITEQNDSLSQKLSQLSTETNDSDDNDETESYEMNKRRRTSTTSSPSFIPKKSKTLNDHDIDDNDKEEYEQIPSFLLSSDKSFEQMIKDVMNTISSIDIDNLRQMAQLIYQIANCGMEKDIKTIYLRSGTGTLKEPEFELTEIDRCVWPKQVISKVVKKSTTAIEMNQSHELVDYEKFVREHLQEIENKIKEYQCQLDEKKSHVVGFTSRIEKTIRGFVYERGIKPIEMKRDLKIALLKYDYDIELNERRYLRENPNEYQLQVAHRLYNAKNQAEKSKRELLELKQRVFYNKPPESYDSIQISMSTSTDTIHQQRMIQQKKLDTMAIHLIKGELRYYQEQKIFEDELSKMWQNHRNLVKNQGMTTVLTNLIEQRFINISDRWRDIYNYRIKYYFQYSYDDMDRITKGGKEQTKKSFGFMPQVIIDTTTTYSFTNKQIQLLNRGPTYVPPYQMHISSSSPSMDDIVKKQLAPLKHQVASLFTKHKVHVNTQLQFHTQIEEEFKNLFSIILPSSLRQRALFEMKLVQTIRSLLKQNKLILRRTSDNMNTFYVGNREDFEKKSNDYLTKTDIYEIVLPIKHDNGDNDNTQQQQPLELQLQLKLHQIVQIINRGLRILKATKALTEAVVDKLVVDMKKTQPSYLYFLPDVSKKNDIKVVPFITSQLSVTSKLATYVNRLLRPFADEKMQSNTISNEFDLIQKLNHYVKIKSRLTSKTTFCTIKITNFYALTTHRLMIDNIVKFLKENLGSLYLDKVPIVTIKNLLELILFNNIFVYKDKIYKFIQGGPNTMPLMETLSDIYLDTWQKYLLDIVMKYKKEFYGRCKDQILFTWNGPTDELRSLLQTLQNTHSNIHFELSIGMNVNFLCTYIENQSSQLYTRIYHDPTIQGYTLPYVIGHSKLQHSDWLQSALIRAVGCCSSVHDFNQERIYLELTYLVNGYSLLFIECHIQHFFNYFHAESMRYILDQAKYDQFRCQWFKLIKNQQNLSDKLQQRHDNSNLIQLNYLYQYGQRCEFNNTFRRIWSDHFGTHETLSNNNSTLTLTTKHDYSLNALLVQYKTFE